MEMHIHTENPEKFLTLLRELLAQGTQVPLSITGNSMTPFLVEKRDTVMLAPVERQLRRGDIIFYVRDNGACVLHRIWKVKDNCYSLVGDAQTHIEKQVRHEQVEAVAVSAIRKGKKISHGSAVWNFFEMIWIRLVPLRPFFRKLYKLTAGRR